MRHAERVLAGDRGVSLDHAVAMLHSKHGLRFLREMMAGCEAEWWTEFQDYVEEQEAARRLEEVRSRRERRSAK